MIRLLLILSLSFTPAVGLSSQAPTSVHPLAVSVAMAMNSTATTESFLNLIGVLTNQAQDINKIKASLDSKTLKMKLPIAKLVNDKIYVGNNIVSITNNKIMVDGMQVHYDTSKGLFENYKIIESEFHKGDKKTALSLLLNSAFAKESRPWEAVLGFLLGVLSFRDFQILAQGFGTAVTENWLEAWFAGIAGAVLFLHSGVVSAAEGIMPVKLCEKIGNSYRNSFKDTDGRSLTQEYSMDNIGNLVVQVKDDGKIESEITVAKKGSAYSIVKMIQSGQPRDVTKIPVQEAQIILGTYESCKDPNSKVAGTSKKLAESIQAGDIQISQPTTDRSQTTKGTGVK